MKATVNLKPVLGMKLILYQSSLNIQLKNQIMYKAVPGNMSSLHTVNPGV